MDGGVRYSELTRFSNILLGLEQGSDIQGLAAPESSVDGPVKRQFQGSSVDGSDRLVSSFERKGFEYSKDVQNSGFG